MMTDKTKLPVISKKKLDKTPENVEKLMASHKFGCSEAVLLAFSPVLGDQWLPKAAVTLSSAFRGGMGGAGCLCGALAGGQMVLSAVLGYRGDADGQQNPEDVKKLREASKELHDKFKAETKSTCCRVLSKSTEPNTPERLANCTGLVKIAAILVKDFLERECPGE